MNGKAPMLGDDRHHRRQIDPLGDADDLGRQLPVQGATAARAAVGTMLDDRVGILAHHAAMAFVTGLGPAGLGLLPPLLVIGRRRLRGGARGLRRTLQPQRQLDQLRPAQPLKIASAHPTKESAKSNLCKRGRPAQSEPRRPAPTQAQTPPWVITPNQL